MVFNRQFIATISPTRFATYQSIAVDDEQAWALYRWNMDLAAAFGPLGCDLEVALRNAIHDQLTAHVGREDWWADTSLLLDEAFTKPPSDESGKVRRPTRAAVHSRASNFHRLRNRCAHHEPIFEGVKMLGTSTRMPILELWAQSIELLRWMSPPLADVHAASDRVPAVFAARPT